MEWLEVPALQAVRNPHLSYLWPSLNMVPLYLQVELTTDCYYYSIY